MIGKRALKVISTVILCVLCSNPVCAAISEREYEMYEDEFKDIFDRTNEAREATFWEKHKWKIIIGCGIIIGGTIIVLSGGAATPLASVASAGCGLVPASTAIGSVALIKSGLILGATATGMEFALTGVGFSRKILEKEGAAAFMNSNTVRYMLRKNITLTASDKRKVDQVLREKRKEIIATSSNKADVFKKIDAVILKVLRSIYR